MSNLKFTLFVTDFEHLPFGYSLMARVFDSQSLLAVHRAIQSGVFGHYSKRRYYLAPLADVLAAEEQREYSSERPLCELKREFQMYPKGGREINPSILGLYPTLAY